MELEVHQHKRSKKFFIYVISFKSDTALMITPRGEGKWLNTDIFEDFYEVDDEELIRKGKINKAGFARNPNKN